MEMPHLEGRKIFVEMLLFTPHQKNRKLRANADRSLVYPKGIFLSDVLELKPAVQAGAPLLKT